MSSLTDFLSDLSAANGNAIPFEVFMREALYHPEHGYYTANIQGVGGRDADFSTSATLLPALAKSMAAWIQTELKHHRQKDDGINDLIEIGPGDATLLFNTMRHLHRRVRRTLNFHLVEVSPILESLQREKLSKFGNVQWHRDIGSALTAAGGRAILYSNELVDAFPATALRHNAELNQWEEIHLSFDPDQGLKEIFLPFNSNACHPERACESKDLSSHPRPPQIASELSNGLKPGTETSHGHSALNSAYPDHQRIELHASYRDWLHQWLPSLKHGSLLTIDYGATADALYHRRPLGTLRAYYKQQRLEGPPEIYARFGKQDLTADVNFTDLRNWGESLGLETVSLQSQADFTATPGDPAAAAFQVLHQRTSP